MEKTISDELKVKFAKLQELWPWCEMEEVSGTDMYYTDGAAQDAQQSLEPVQPGAAPAA